MTDKTQPGASDLPDRRMASFADLAARIEELERRKAQCRTRAERRPINQQLHTMRQILRSVESLSAPADS